MQGERIIKIGSYLPKLSQKDCVGVLFWLTMQQRCCMRVCCINLQLTLTLILQMFQKCKDLCLRALLTVYMFPVKRQNCIGLFNINCVWKCNLQRQCQNALKWLTHTGLLGHNLTLSFYHNVWHLFFKVWFQFQACWRPMAMCTGQSGMATTRDNGYKPLMNGIDAFLTYLLKISSV